MPLKALGKLPKVMFKHTKSTLNLPDPCIYARKGAGKKLVTNFFDPTTAFQVEVGTLLKQKKPARKQKKPPMKKYCLF